MTYQELEQQHTSGVYPKRDLTLVRGKDATVWDDEGREYIDCASSQGVAPSATPTRQWPRPSSEQATHAVQLPARFSTTTSARSSWRRCRPSLPPALKRFFLCNSGAEAVEAAHQVRPPEHRPPEHRGDRARLPRPHHGRALGHVRAEIPRAVQAAACPASRHVPYNNLEALDEAVTDETGGDDARAGAGRGRRAPGHGRYLRGAREICRPSAARC